MSIQLYEHNKEAYLQVEQMFQTSRKAAVIHPTGTGKSYIAFALCEAHPDHPILWISPSDYIYKTQRENLRRSNPELSLEHVHFYTYTRLTLFTDEELAKISEKKPAYVILDEFHRAGATVWGQSVSRLLDVCQEAKILGLSATSIRYLDNCRDMADELFDGQIASELTLADAMAKRILPSPTYVASFYQFGEELERLQEQANRTGNDYLRLVLNNKIKQAKRMLADRQCGLPDIFGKHLKQSEGHYIVFCSSEERLDAAMKECDDWFYRLKPQPQIHKYKVLSRYSSSRQEFTAFDQDQTAGVLKLLFCVDMLNEGIHMEHINGVIMLRATESANVYYQQLGRALACGGSGHPLIFDLVNNFENTSSGSLPEGLIYQLRNEAEAGGGDLDFEIYDYILDLAKALEDIKNTFEQSWAASYEALRKFITRENRFPNRKEVAEGVHLGDWCSVQRAQYKKGVLQPERIQQLEQIGFCFDLYEDAWNTSLADLKAYVHDTGSLPRSCDNRTLYTWLNTQKQAWRDGQLDENRQAQLEALGVQLNGSFSEARWESNCEALKAFIEAHGRQPLTSEVANGIKLGAWLCEQRRRQSAGTLTCDQQKKLQDLGVRFDERRDRAFAENFELLKAFIKEYDRQPLTVESYKGFGLGAWCLRLREQYKNGELSDQQIRDLKSLGFDLRSAREAKNADGWEKNFAEVKEYLETHGVMPKSREYPGLYRWVRKQKDAVKRGELRSGDVVRLKELGMV